MMHLFCQLFLSDECKSISQWENDDFHSWVLRNEIIELTDTLGLLVSVVSGVDDMTIP